MNNNNSQFYRSLFFFFFTRSPILWQFSKSLHRSSYLVATVIVLGPCIIIHFLHWGSWSTKKLSDLQLAMAAVWFQSIHFRDQYQRPCSTRMWLLERSSLVKLPTKASLPQLPMASFCPLPIGSFPFTSGSGVDFRSLPAAAMLLPAQDRLRLRPSLGP